jgi:hypothetical protein
MIKIYADFNSCDDQGRVMLNTVGSLRDLERHKKVLAAGMQAIFYAPGEFEVHGTLVFEGIWIGIPDWSTILYEGSEQTPK